jgi:hypothetical protein
MYAVTDRPAARDRRTSCSTSRTMLSAFAMGSCRQNSSSVAMMTPTHATDTRRAQVHTHRANQSNAFPVGIGCRKPPGPRAPFLGIGHPCRVLELGTISEASVWGWELVASRADGNDRCARFDGRRCVASVGPAWSAVASCGRLVPICVGFYPRHSVTASRPLPRDLRHEQRQLQERNVDGRSHRGAQLASLVSLGICQKGPGIMSKHPVGRQHLSDRMS